jgi:glycosyltransferase involved in cell wall biosynthesis
VAVVIAVRDGAAYLAEALESALNQTRPPAEVVVVDHGSSDASPDVARSFGPPVECISAVREHAGPPRNEGVEATTSPLLAFLDADDLWAPDKLERQVARLEEPDEPDLVFGEMEEFVSPDAAGLPSVPPARPRQPAPLIGLLLLRRTTFEAVGPFREDLLANELEWMARARRLGVREVSAPGAVLRRRVHATNHSRRAAYRMAAARALAVTQAERRALGG